jgi:hypothetical protein
MLEASQESEQEERGREASRKFLKKMKCNPRREIRMSKDATIGRTLCWATLALLLLIPPNVWSGETGKDTTKNKNADSQYLGKATNETWEMSVQSLRGEMGKVDVYIDSGSVGETPRRTIKSTDLMGAILGKMETSEDRYILVVKMKIKNLQKKKMPFYLDDLSLKSGSDSVSPHTYARGDDALPLMTKHNVEFMVQPAAEEHFYFLFSAPRKGADLSLQFKDLHPINMSSPAMPGSVKRRKE